MLESEVNDVTVCAEEVTSRRGVGTSDCAPAPLQLPIPHRLNTTSLKFHFGFLLSQMKVVHLLFCFTFALRFWSGARIDSNRSSTIHQAPPSFWARAKVSPRQKRPCETKARQHSRPISTSVCVSLPCELYKRSWKGTHQQQILQQILFN